MINDNTENNNTTEKHQGQFYGCEIKDLKSINPDFPGINKPADLYNALLGAWCAETCTARLRDKWNENNKTLGQCTVTAFLAQDIFGGEVYGILRPDGNYHCYNVVGDCCFDLTREQFGEEAESLSYENNPEQFREIHFSKDDKKQRYELLKWRLHNILNGSGMD